MNTHAIPPKLVFKMSRLLQTELGAWRDCQHQTCQQRQMCLGGPRGTCSKTGGWPLCTDEGRERYKIAKSAKVWPGEKSDKSETISERKWRRFDEMMRRLTMQAKLESTANQKADPQLLPSSTPPWQ